jgi:hypothetical protein
MGDPAEAGDSALLELDHALDALVAAARRRAASPDGTQAQQHASAELQHAIERLRDWDRPGADDRDLLASGLGA